MGLGHKLAKNLPELRALAAGAMPSWVTQGSTAVPGVPVFVFHGVGPDRLAEQLRFLVENGWATLTAAELTERIESESAPVPAPKSVVLTFDDASWSLWSYAFPLLRHYGLTAIAFAIPGLVSETAAELPQLDLAGWTSGSPLPRLHRGQIFERVKSCPLATWAELGTMAETGVIDVQSHSLFHPRVQVHPRVVNFHNPKIDRDYYGNVGLPLTIHDDPRAPKRSLRGGTPVLEFASRFADVRSFLPTSGFGEASLRLVADEGGERFFEHPDWRMRLQDSVEPPDGSYETDAEREDAIRHEMKESKFLLESRLHHEVSHFCYPWFQGSNRADLLAGEAGYRATHYGLDASFPSSQPMRGAGSVWRVPRLSEEYLERLPGQGRRTVLSIWRDRLGRRGHPRGEGI